MSLCFVVISVINPSQEACYADHVMTATGEGYLANIITDQTGCGSTNAPWRIVGEQGQRIELKLMDFASWVCLNIYRKVSNNFTINYFRKFIPP